MARMIPFLVNLRPEQKDLLQEHADLSNKKLSEVIRDAVDLFLYKDDEDDLGSELERS